MPSEMDKLTTESGNIYRVLKQTSWEMCSQYEREAEFLNGLQPGGVILLTM